MGITAIARFLRLRKSMVLMIVPFFLSFVFCYLMLLQWQRIFGTKEQDVTKSEQRIEVKREPQLQVRSIKIIQGEQLSLLEIAQATDEYGTDISSQISFSCDKGNIKNGVFDTKKAGVYQIEVSVISPVSGKKISQKVQILVDGRVIL